MITQYHTKYFAYELTKRCSSDSIQKLMVSLADAQVDLNPHQVDAALFAFRSPFSKGVLLADEVGLGKTIEAGIILSQKCAEGKNKILIIVPSSLRKQWLQELADKFFLSSVILESSSFNYELKQGAINPFERNKEIVICSYHFARSKHEFLKLIDWDLVVIDEAHRLRNIYRSDNKIAKAIHDAIASAPKVLLTATPLQNSLLELYGLIYFIDQHIFGDIKSFKEQFVRIVDDAVYRDLRSRIKPVCQRTLRRQVLEYIQYTNRLALVQEFTPGEDEQRLYEDVSEYLRCPKLYALPTGQRQLITLILRKLLASSPFAIAKTLNSLVARLEGILCKDNKLKSSLKETIADDYEQISEIEDEWDGNDAMEELAIFSSDQLVVIRQEISNLKQFAELAESITHDAKGKVLLQALETGFKKAQELGAQRKALIFTESRRTQEYLYRLLSESEYKDKIVLFNGTNSDRQAKKIYQAWLEKYQGTDKISGSSSADKRAALVEYFTNQAEIMIATESAAEGVNLQFCSLVVNYDLPWNPQRIEQRIGRCHRYGQKHDVVVVNFLNKENEADKRVYELLDEKFKLFNGVFGASDEILGAIESGVDFEKRIAEIYQHCRKPEEIEAEFNTLRADLEDKINEQMNQTRKKVFENLDEEVHEKLRISKEEGKNYLNKYEAWLWDITKYALADYANFSPEDYSFHLKSNPFPNLRHLPIGPYRMGRGVDIAKEHIYRLGHPIAQEIIQKAKSEILTPAEIIFDYSNCGKQITIIKDLVNKSGLLVVFQLTVEALEIENYIICLGCHNNGSFLTDEQCARLFSVPGVVSNETVTFELSEKLKEELNNKERAVFSNIEKRNADFFDTEMTKLDKWAEDLKNALETEIKELDREIKQLKRDSKLILKLEEKVKAQRHIKDLEKKRHEKRNHLFQAQDDIEARKESLIDNIEQRLKQSSKIEEIFRVKWRVI
ncbi:MAG: DEAD/DEAH box helicase [Gammaproteobacteria bacterium GWE2_37_16]|nr:MAG: DEAD/DEAH box helicase [Gammaproteobacteria bacterium GWE2_37_16]